jgi:hypothetical protein
MNRLWTARATPGPAEEKTRKETLEDVVGEEQPARVSSRFLSRVESVPRINGDRLHPSQTLSNHTLMFQWTFERPTLQLLNSYDPYRSKIQIKCLHLNLVDY